MPVSSRTHPTSVSRATPTIGHPMMELRAPRTEIDFGDGSAPNRSMNIGRALDEPDSLVAAAVILRGRLPASLRRARSRGRDPPGRAGGRP